MQLCPESGKIKGVTPEDYALFKQMVPKRGLEPRQAIAH